MHGNCCKAVQFFLTMTFRIVIIFITFIIFYIIITHYQLSFFVIIIILVIKILRKWLSFTPTTSATPLPHHTTSTTPLLQHTTSTTPLPHHTTPLPPSQELECAVNTPLGSSKPCLLTSQLSTLCAGFEALLHRNPATRCLFCDTGLL